MWNKLGHERDVGLNKEGREWRGRHGALQSCRWNMRHRKSYSERFFLCDVIFSRLSLQQKSNKSAIQDRSVRVNHGSM